MFKSSLLPRFVFILLAFLSQPLLAQDQLGVFFDSEGTTNSVTTTDAYSQVSAWVQLLDASASDAITAFEFRLEVHSDGPDPILVWTLPSQALNIEEAPVFMVGLGVPMAIEPRMTLAEVLIIVPEAEQTVWLTVHPLEQPSLLDPPGSGYPVCHPAYAPGSEGEMVAMIPVTGCDSEPVASINPDGNPPLIEVGGLPASISLQKDDQGKQIEYINIRNFGPVSYSGVAYVSGTTPMQFEIDGLYVTEGPVTFQVPIGGSTRITPYYEGGGSVDATIELEICDDQWSIPVGDPNGWVDCAWAEETLVFGEVVIGQSEVREIELVNSGFELLPIPSSFHTDHFSFLKIQHNGDFLDIGESCTYRVTFEPATIGIYYETASIGADFCSLDLEGVCIDGPPQCQANPSNLVFQDFDIAGNAAVQYFVIRNIGGGALEGTVSLNDNTGVFYLEYNSGGPFSLGYNQTKTVYVGFNPSEEGDYLAEVDLGTECENVPLSGNGLLLLPECLVSVSVLDFGDFVVGGNPRSRNFEIRNVGGGFLQGTVALNDTTGAFSYYGGSFSLPPNATKRIYVSFDPSEEGLHSAELDFGLECGVVPLIGNAIDLPPECTVSVSDIIFPEHVIGGSPEYRYFNVRNTGGGLLEGTITLADTASAFGIRSWQGNSFSLPHNCSRSFYVYFDPQTAGYHSNEIDLGLDCPGIFVSGTAIDIPPQCELSGYTFADGILTINPIPVGGSRIGYLRIKNTGGGLLAGQATLDDTSGVFQFSGEEQYSLHNGESIYLRVQFTPQEVGPASTVLHTGSICGDVEVVAEGEESYADCYSYMYSTDFDRVAVGDTATAFVVVGNDGYLDLDGDFLVDGEGFQFENPGPFTLMPGEYLYEKLWFIPETVGDFQATVSTGLPLCPGDWQVDGFSVPAGSDRMGFYFDSEGTDNTLITDHPKVREKAYLVLHNPSTIGQLSHWYVYYWGHGSAMVMDDWQTEYSGTLTSNSYRTYFYAESPIPYTETMVLAEFSVLITNHTEASMVEVGYASYKNVDGEGYEYVVIQDPVDLLINQAKSELTRLPATPVGKLNEGKVVLEWPCGKLDFEGFHVYRRVDDGSAEKLTTEPIVCIDGEGRYEDTSLPEEGSELHYFMTSLFKGKESEPGLALTLELAPPQKQIPVPTQTRLLAIYPNPFNPETKISFEIAQPGRVQIRIYDVSGRLVRNLTDMHFDAGRFEETWNGRDDSGRTLPSNVYYARMAAGSVVQMRKMTLLK